MPKCHLERVLCADFLLLWAWDVDEAEELGNEGGLPLVYEDEGSIAPGGGVPYMGWIGCERAVDRLYANNGGRFAWLSNCTRNKVKSRY